MGSGPRFLVLGNLENRRVAGFRAALAGRGLPPARELSWLSFLRGERGLDEALAGVRWLRVESPGEDAAVERELLALGAAEADPAGRGERISAEAARRLPADRGRIRAGRQRFLGLRAALRRVDAALARSGARALVPPAAIALCCDKAACHARCLAAGVAVPRALPPVDSYAELRAAMRAHGLRRVFLKPRHGSSASGVIALALRRLDPGSPLMARTPVEAVREGGALRLYNSLKVRRITDEAELAALVDVLAPEGLHVEEWIPKATLGGRACDLRLVVVGGRAEHAVVRQSATPLTNLHLGNARGDLAAFQALVGRAGWAALQELALQAVALLDGALYCGVDLLVAPGGRRRAVLELNAFGDLLPRVLAGGRDTYAAEVDAALQAA